MTDTYDVIVLGAGSTGTNVAWYARDNDLTVGDIGSMVHEALLGAMGRAQLVIDAGATRQEDGRRWRTGW